MHAITLTRMSLGDVPRQDLSLHFMKGLISPIPTPKPYHTIIDFNDLDLYSFPPLNHIYYIPYNKMHAITLTRMSLGDVPGQDPPLHFMQGLITHSPTPKPYYTIIDFNDLDMRIYLPKSDIHRGNKATVNISFKGTGKF